MMFFVILNKMHHVASEKSPYFDFALIEGGFGQARRARQPVTLGYTKMFHDDAPGARASNILSSVLTGWADFIHFASFLFKTTVF